jgi:Domain of unknown function (DUF4129)
VLSSLGVLALVLMVWAATTGPVRMLGTAARHSTSAPSRLPPSATPHPGRGSPAPTYRDLTAHVQPVVDLSWLGQLIGYTAVLAACYGVFLVLRSLWRNRWRPPEKRPDVGFEVLPDQAVLESLHDDAQAQLAALDRGGPRDSIVACWLRLEEIVADSGVPARPSETSTELVTRVLHELDLDPRPVATLASLYREARFSEHPMGEASRQQARSALHRLHEDALALGAGR